MKKIIILSFMLILLIGIVTAAPDPGHPLSDIGPGLAPCDGACDDADVWDFGYKVQVGNDLRVVADQWILGNLGIGVADDPPTADLDVAGSVRFRNGAALNRVLTSNAQGYATWEIPQTGLSGGIQYVVPRYASATAIQPGGIYDQSDARAITIDSNERVGVGTTTPDANSKLHVEGTLVVDYMIRADDASGISIVTDDGTPRLVVTDGGTVQVKNQIQIEGGSPADGKVLTSTDVNGLAEWRDPSSGMDG
ncbi:MAG: hypothetical protein ABIE94_05110, partial [archaeon]